MFWWKFGGQIHTRELLSEKIEDYSLYGLGKKIL